MDSKALLRLEGPNGSGKAVCLLIDSDSLQEFGVSLEAVETFAESLSSKYKVLRIFLRAIDYRNVAALQEALTEILSEQKVRQAGFVTFGSASLLLWKLAIINQKCTRYALVVNGETRPQATGKERLSSWLEHKLPLGLPFRVSEGRFHALPFLQRFRFPVFITTTSAAGEHQKQEALILQEELPVAWSAPLEEDKTLEEQLESLVDLLHGVPAKCPQKNRVSA